MTEWHSDLYVQICMLRFEHKVHVHCIRVSLEVNSNIIQRAKAWLSLHARMYSYTVLQCALVCTVQQTSQPRRTQLTSIRRGTSEELITLARSLHPRWGYSPNQRTHTPAPNWRAWTAQAQAAHRQARAHPLSTPPRSLLSAGNAEVMKFRRTWCNWMYYIMAKYVQTPMRDLQVAILLFLRPEINQSLNFCS